jgi:regulator of protease activity HflC (stomatin/prohibitin superfamily)
MNLLPIGVLSVVISTLTTVCIFFLITPFLRKREEELYQKARRIITDLDRTSLYAEALVYGVCMLIFVTVTTGLATQFGISMWLSLGVNSLAWIAIYISLGWTEVDAQDFQIVESFGNFKRVILSGPNILCFPGLIDKPKKLEFTMKKDFHEFFQDSSGTNNFFVDFGDDYIAKIKMTIWFKIENPILWVYKVEGQPTKWIEDHLLRIALHIMERLPLEYASKHKIEIEGNTLSTLLTIEGDSDSAQKMISKHLGIKLTSFIINDIDIPPEVREIRMEVNRGKAERDRRIAIVQGYYQSVQAIREEAKKLGIDMSWDDAKALHDENETRRVMDSSNITIVTPDLLESIPKMLGGNKS